MSDIPVYMGKREVLSAKEQIRLVKLAQKGDIEARNRVIECNIPFLISRAKRFSSNHASIDDLVSAGVFGLVRAIEKFSPSRNVTFLTYAKAWIDNFIQQYNANTKTIVRLPEYMYRVLSKARSNDVVFTPKGVRVEADVLAKVLSATTEVQNIDDISVVDRYGYPEDELEEKESMEADKDLVKELLRTLSKRERDAIKKYYGIDCESKTYEGVSKCLKTSPATARNLVVRGLEKLRSGLVGSAA